MAKTLVENKTLSLVTPFLTSFERHLRAERKDPDTIDHYVGATRQFAAFCEAGNLPPLAGIRREHVEMWLGDLHERYRPATVRNRYIGLRLFFKWLLDEGEITRSPMERIKPPSVEESPKDVVSPQDMDRAFKLLEKGKRWRDCALVAVLYDTGMRASEVADCRSEHIDLDSGYIFIPKTKTDRVRTVHLAARGTRYLDRYWRTARPAPDYAVNGHRGKLTRSGVYSIVRDIFEEVGVRGIIGAHDLRHTSASHVAAAGLIGDADALTLYGWTNPTMWRHYTEQARQEAALSAHKRASPLDRLPRK